jgi:hypothetical protein
MEIKFELNEKQIGVLNVLLAHPQNSGVDANEACRRIVVMNLIKVRQEIVAKELS